MLNTVCLVGRVATKPDVAYTATQTAVATFRLAVDRPPRDGDDETADFFTVKAYGRLAEAQGDHLEVGRLVAVAGRLRTEPIPAKGDKPARERTVVVASSIDWLGPKRIGADQVGAGA